MFLMDVDTVLWPEGNLRSTVPLQTLVVEE